MMRRVAGVILLLVGVAGMVAAVAGVAAVWHYKPILTDYGTALGGKAEQLLGKAGSALREGETLLAQARKDLDAFHAVTAQAPAPAEAPSSGLQKFLFQKLAAEFLPHADDARRLLDSAVDVAVVVNSVLEGLDEASLGSVTDLKADQLKEAAGEVRGLIGQAQKLQGLLQGEPGGPSAADLTATTEEMKSILDRVTDKVQGLLRRVDNTYAHVAEVNAGLPGWISTAAVALTVFLSWFALGQVCLVARGWAWLRARADE